MNKKTVIIISILLVVLAIAYWFLSRRIDEDQKTILKTLGEDPSEDVKRSGGTVILYTSKFFSEPVKFKRENVVVTKVNGTRIEGTYKVNSNGRPAYDENLQKLGNL